MAVTLRDTNWEYVRGNVPGGCLEGNRLGGVNVCDKTSGGISGSPLQDHKSSGITRVGVTLCGN